MREAGATALKAVDRAEGARDSAAPRKLPLRVRDIARALTTRTSSVTLRRELATRRPGK